MTHARTNGLTTRDATRQEQRAFPGTGAPCLDALEALDVYAVFRVVGEILERGEDPLHWRAHMSGWLRARLGASIVVDAEAAAEISGADDIVALDPAGTQWARAAKLAATIGEVAVPLWVVAASLARTNGTERQSLVNPERPLDGPGQCMLSVRTLAGLGLVHVISVARHATDPAFEERERQLLALLHDELARHVIVPEAGGKPLTPVLRATLAALLCGDSEKEAADRLHIGLDTLHDRIRRLYRQVGARSRGELIAKATAQYYVPRPRLHQSPGGPETTRWPETTAA